MPRGGQLCPSACHPRVPERSASVAPSLTLRSNEAPRPRLFLSLRLVVHAPAWPAAKATGSPRISCTFRPSSCGACSCSRRRVYTHTHMHVSALHHLTVLLGRPSLHLASRLAPKRSKQGCLGLYGCIGLCRRPACHSIQCPILQGQRSHQHRPYQFISLAIQASMLATTPAAALRKPPG